MTSRVRLNLSVEYEFPVSPLALPAKESRASVSDALESPAVRLFLDRAEAVRFYFVLTDEIAPIISALCERLDGIPLAIELAAAQVRLLSPARLLEQMHQRFAVLRSDQLDRPARHQSLQEAIAWSYNLLTVGEQVLFRRLGVFMGGMTTEAAEAVAGLKPGAGLDASTALADKSLLQVGTGALDEPRFWMLETIREFALERLRLSGEASITNFRHFNFYLDAAATAGAHLTSRDQDDWLDRLEISIRTFVRPSTGRATNGIPQFFGSARHSGYSGSSVDTGLRGDGLLIESWRFRAQTPRLLGLRRSLGQVQ